jgi:cysteine-rich repeat protein
VCGNGVVESPEQCDDSNTSPGDGCSAVCESEGPNCDAVAGSTVIGARQVTVAIGGLVGGQKLAGVRINLDYPQFQAGIAGSGQSSIVQSQVMVLQGTPGDYIALANDHDTDLVFVIGGTADFIDNGDLITVTMDACFAKELNLCNRNQNVIGCCDASTDLDGDTTFQECGDPNAPVVCPAGSFPTSTVGIPAIPPALEDCCPADNACVTQAAATSCTVTDPVDSNGLPVDGVTCTVAISGT